MAEEEFPDLYKQIPDKSKVPLHKLKKQDVSEGYKDHVKEILSRKESKRSDLDTFHTHAKRVLDKKFDTE